MPSAGKKGVGKLIAMIGGGVLVLAAVVAGILFMTKKKGDTKTQAGTGNTAQQAKDNRVKCANNCSANYKAMLAFAQDNGERLPWQLTPSGVRNHLGAAPQGIIFGMQQNRSLNEVNAHPNVLQTAGVWGLLAVKRELQTPKILHSPCDPARAKQNEQVQENWTSYNTKVNGVSAQLGGGTSYTLVRGADTQRPSSVLLVTRNWSGDNLGSGYWLGSDSDKGNDRTMDGLNKSQGQVVTMDGGVRRFDKDDLGVTRSASTAAGGVARGPTSLNIMRGAGL